jgi:hypothetical protein
MVMTAGAVRVAVSFMLACGKGEGDSDLRVICLELSGQRICG